MNKTKLFFNTDLVALQDVMNIFNTNILVPLNKFKYKHDNVLQCVEFFDIYLYNILISLSLQFYFSPFLLHHIFFLHFSSCNSSLSSTSYTLKLEWTFIIEK